MLVPTEQNGKLELVPKDVILSQLDVGSVVGDEITTSRAYKYTVVAKSSEVRVLELVRFQFQELKYFGMYDDLKALSEQYRYMHSSETDWQDQSYCLGNSSI